MTKTKSVRTQGKQQHRGFTLLEVMIALAILSIALGAIITGVSTNINNAARLESKTYAHWVAMNKVAELQLDKAWHPTGTKKGSVVMAKIDFFWQTEISSTPDKDIQRLDVEVRSKDDKAAPLASLVAFLGRP